MGILSFIVLPAYMLTLRFAVKSVFPLLLLILLSLPLHADEDVEEIVDDSVAEEVEAVEDDLDDEAEDAAAEGLDRAAEEAAEAAQDALAEALERRQEAQGKLDEVLGDTLENQVEHLLERTSAAEDESITDDLSEEELTQLWDVEERLDNLELDALPDQFIKVLTPGQLQQARVQGLTILATQPLQALGGILVTFAPLPDDAELDVAPNHLYQLDGDSSPQTTESEPPLPAAGLAAMTGLQAPLPAQRRIGLMDSAIDTAHPCLQTADVIQRSFVAAGSQPDQRHGTAMASVMAGAADCGAAGVLSQATLVNAIVFARSPQGPVVASATQLITGLDWLLQEQVRLVNLSLSGPPNPVLEAALTQARKLGVQLISSVGNEGGAAFPRYPAAYDSVLAVTAVDRNKQIFTRAVRGDHVELAAPGVGMAVAGDGGTYRMDGTSLAAALTTAALAVRPPQDAADERRQLQQSALDLGEPGRDTVYGYGLLQMQGLTEINAENR